MILILEGIQSNKNQIIFILNCLSWWFIQTVGLPTQTAVKRNNLRPASAASPAKIPWTISESLWFVSSRGILLVANTSSSCLPRLQPITKFSAIMIFNSVFCFFQATGKRWSPSHVWKKGVQLAGCGVPSVLTQTCIEWSLMKVWLVWANILMGYVSGQREQYSPLLSRQMLSGLTNGWSPGACSYHEF